MSGVAVAPVRFNEADAERASDEWGANCGPGALAGILGLTLDEVRPHMGDFEAKGYTNPTLMYRALDSLGAQWWKLPKGEWPTYGLVRVQWHGPWMEPGVPMRARFRYTHWIGTARIGRSRGVFDINAINNGLGWTPLSQWARILVPHLTAQYPKADGEWSIANSLEVTP